MRNDHPFAIPEHVQKEIAPYLELIGRPDCNTQDAAILSSSAPYGLHLLNEFEDVLINLRSILEALDTVSGDLTDKRDACLFRTISLGLEREIMRGQAVWDWARATWKYDPAIHRLISGGNTPNQDDDHTVQ
jgi:hypothetical protein